MQEDIIEKVIELGEKYKLINDQCLVENDISRKIIQLPIEVKDQILEEIYSQFSY